MAKAAKPGAPTSPRREYMKKEYAPSMSLDLQNILGNVRMIMDGLRVGGESNRSRKAYASNAKEFHEQYEV